MTDTKILESRLLTRESAIGGSSLSRCAGKLQQYLKSLELQLPQQESGSEVALNNEYEIFLREIFLYQVEMKKYDEIYAMCDEEIKDYQLLENEIQQKIIQTQSSIDHLTTELAQQRSLRRHREECENLAKIVNSVPNCEISKQKIAQLEDEIAKVNDQIAAQDAREKLRLRQFKLIGQAIAEMSRSLDEETEAQNELLILQQQLQSTNDGGGDGEEEENENDDNDGEEGGSRDKRTEKSDHTEHKAKKPRLEDVEEEEGEEGQQRDEEGEGEKDQQVKDDLIEGNSQNIPVNSSSTPVGDNSGSTSPRVVSSTSASPRATSASSISSPRGQSAVLRQQALASKKIHEPEEGEEEEGTKLEEKSPKTEGDQEEKTEVENGMEIVS